jgi:hypothetical protein
MASYENLSCEKFDKESRDMKNDLLPEDVVSNILSRLRTAEAVRTSILSKRWRNLWTTISHLDFSAEKCRNEEQIKNFEKHVNTVMLRLNPTNSIDKCSLFFGNYSDALQIKKWISYAAERNVKDLTLQTFNFNSPMDLPCRLFDCKPLEALSLYHGLHLKIPNRGFVCFPNLKFLSLEFVSISGIPAEKNSPCFPKLKNLRLVMIRYAGKDDCVMKLIRNCPLLEDLTIHRVLEHNVSNVDMCIPQLTEVILSCGWIDEIFGLNAQIEAPIKYLEISAWNPTHRIIVKNRDSLIWAILRFRRIQSYDFQGEQRDELLKILKSVDNVKYLSLLTDVIDAIKASRIRLPLFTNVIRLEMYLGCKDFYMLECLLNSTVNLQILVIYKIRVLTFDSIEERCK